MARKLREKRIENREYSRTGPVDFIELPGAVLLLRLCIFANWPERYPCRKGWGPETLRDSGEQ